MWVSPLCDGAGARGASGAMADRGEGGARGDGGASGEVAACAAGDAWVASTAIGVSEALEANGAPRIGAAIGATGAGTECDAFGTVVTVISCWLFSLTGLCANAIICGARSPK